MGCKYSAINGLYCTSIVRNQGVAKRAYTIVGHVYTIFAHVYTIFAHVYTIFAHVWALILMT